MPNKIKQNESLRIDGAKNRLTMQRLKQLPITDQLWADGMHDTFAGHCYGYVQGIDTYLPNHRIYLLSIHGELHQCLKMGDISYHAEVSREYCLENGACLYWPDLEYVPFSAEWIEDEKANHEFWLRFQDKRHEAINVLRQIII